MKLFLNSTHKLISIVGFIITIPLFMWLMPFGSFDPQASGFWLSILAALLVEILGNFLFTKLYQNWGTDKKD